MLRHVVFDIGGVLLDWNPRHLYRRIFSNSGEMEAFLAKLEKLEWNLAQDGGRTWGEGVAAFAALYPDERHLIEPFHHRWLETVKAPLWDTVALQRRLKAKGVRLFAITNYSAEKYDLSLGHFPFLNEFEDTVVSGKERLLKPDPAIYRLLLDRNGLEARHCLFIDDAEKNVTGARAVGLAAHHFQGAAGLEDELQRLGLL